MTNLLTRLGNIFKGPVGPVGPMGAQGPQGAPGLKGDMPTYRSPRFTAVKMSTKAAPPRRAHEGDAGYDLALDTTKSVVLLPGEVTTVPTGWSVRLDPATCGIIVPRSGNASKLGLDVITGIVDSGYDGELKVTVHNTTRDKVVLTPGMRIAQMVVIPVVNHDAPAKDTKRGVNGFGSTDTSVDMVNHPPHYTVHPVFTGECHDYAKHMTFDQGNAFKYLWRVAGKGDMRENLSKAMWYLKAMGKAPDYVKNGNVLATYKVAKLEAEVTAARNEVDPHKAPTKYVVALMCYSMAALVANGEITAAVEVGENALKRLDSVK